MAHIEKRTRGGRVSYRARYRAPDGTERNKTFRRKADAEKFLATVESAKLRGAWTDPAAGRTTLAAWLEEWWGSAADLRPSTVARDEAYFNSLILPRFGGVPLAAIRQPDVQAWVAELSARGFRPATVVKAYQLLGRTMTAAVNADMVPRSPCRAVRLPKVEREEMRFLNPAEVARLANVIDSRYRALVLVAAYGGLRIGELAGLRRRRIDLLRSTVDVAEIVVEVRGELYMGPPKTRAGRRIVTLPRSVVEELAEHLGPVGEADAWVFTADKGGVLRPSNFRVKCGCRRSGRPGWCRCAPTICGTRRWRCGSPPGLTLRRLACGPGTPRWRSRWIATATCSLATMTSCATAWTRCTPRASRLSPAGRWWSCRAARRGPSRPQRGPRRSKQTSRPAVVAGLSCADGGAPPGTRTPNRCLKRALLCQLS
jgi:integrase